MTTADNLRRIAAEIISLAARMETPEPVEDTLAQAGTLCDVHADPTANVLGTPPARRHYQRNGKRMADALMVPDLFTQMGIAVEDTLAQAGTLCDVHADPTANVLGTPPARRHYQRNGKRMADALMVPAYQKVGKKQGYCIRGDIERTIVRITGRNREDVREAVNRIAERMQITCVKSRSYRYYPRSLRAKIINDACQELERI